MSKQNKSPPPVAVDIEDQRRFVDRLRIVINPPAGHSGFVWLSPKKYGKEVPARTLKIHGLKPPPYNPL